jgi:cation diffusion facilitator family transporter
MNPNERHEHGMAEFRHSHEFGGQNLEGERRTAWVTWLTLVTMAVEIAAGWMTGSMALLADGWHMGTHATALGIAWAAFVFARRHSLDPRFAFGTGRVGILAAFGSAMLLGAVALLMFWESGMRLIRPAVIRFDEALLVAAAGLVVNVVSAMVLGRRGDHEHSHPHHDERHSYPGHDFNLRAAYVHVLADALTSVLAIAALLAARQWGWMRADPLMGIVGGAIVLRWAWTLARQTGCVLIDGDVDPAERDAIRKVVESDGETRVADLHIWRVGAREKAAILSLVTGCPQPPAHYRELLRPFEELKHISIEVNVCAGKACGACR